MDTNFDFDFFSGQPSDCIFSWNQHESDSALFGLSTHEWSRDFGSPLTISGLENIGFEASSHVDHPAKQANGESSTQINRVHAPESDLPPYTIEHHTTTPLAVHGLANLTDGSATSTSSVQTAFGPTQSIHATIACEKCGKSFRRLCDLTKHLGRSNHGSEQKRNHACEICGQAFLYPKDLKRHEKVHSKDLQMPNGTGPYQMLASNAASTSSLSLTSKRTSSNEWLGAEQDSGALKSKTRRTTKDPSDSLAEISRKVAPVPAVNALLTTIGKEFVLNEDLYKHFKDPEMVKALLSSIGSTLTTSYMRILACGFAVTFSILLFIDQGNAIGEFIERDIGDACLPLLSKPDDFPDFTLPLTGDSLWDLFAKQQRRFCPPMIRGRGAMQRFPPDVVLPFTEKTLLVGTSKCSVYKVILHAARDRTTLEKAATPRCTENNVYVLKTYHHSKDVRRWCKFELNQLKQLNGMEIAHPNIVAFSSSYAVGESYNILWKYADIGTLEELFHQAPEPRTRLEITNFWCNLLMIVNGVLHIHTTLQKLLGNRHSDSLTRSWSRLGPNRIFVAQNLGMCRFDYTFKLPSLETTLFKVLYENESLSNNAIPLISDELESTDDTFTSVTDEAALVPDNIVWRLVCIFSEAAVWVPLGRLGLDGYRAARRQKLGPIRDLEIDANSHETWWVSGAADSWHRQALEARRLCDDITPVVITDIIKSILSEPGGLRPSIEHLAASAQETLQNIKRQQSLQGTSLPSSVHASCQHHPPFTLTPSKLVREAMPMNDSESHHRQQQRAKGNGGPSASGDTIRAKLLLSNFSTTSKTTSETNALREGIGEPRKQSDILGKFNVLENELPAVRDSNISTIDSEPSNPFEFFPDTFSHVPSIPTSKTVQRATPALQQPHVPKLSIAAALRYYESRKLRTPAKLPYDAFLGELERTDHIFLVDDSSTMSPYRQELTNLVLLLSYIIKQSDPDGMDLLFSCSPSKIRNAKTSQTLATECRNHHFSGISDPNLRISTILCEHTARETPKYRFSTTNSKLRPWSLYVFTDGAWKTDFGQLNHTLEAFGRLETPTGLPLRPGGIQFISFGDNKDGLQRLQYLCQRHDSVDTEPSSGNIWKMLLGSTAEIFKNNG